MLDLGRFPYINADTTNPVKNYKVSVASNAEAKFAVNFKNEGKTSRVIKENEAVYAVLGADGTQIAAGVNAANVVVGAGASAKLFDEIEIEKSDLEANAGKTIIIKIDVDGEAYEELKVYVLSNDTSAKSVTVAGVAVDLTATPLTVELPFGTDLDELEEDDIVVVTNHAKAEVTDITIDTSMSKVDIEITAEDGSTGTISIALTVDAGDNTDLSSKVYIVDNTNKTITMPATADVATFKANLKAATGATFEVYESDETTIKVGDMVSGDKVIVTALDGSTTATYTVTVQQ